METDYGYRLIEGNFRHIQREKIVVEMCVVETVPKKYS